MLNGDHSVALATIAAATLATLVALITYQVEKRRSRHERYARTFAEAIQAVVDYLEAPYRIRRRPMRDPRIRYELTALVSDIQSRISFYEAWLATTVPTVATAYSNLVAAARREAGPEMTAAWRAPATRSDGDVPLGQRYEHPLADAARDRCLAAMLAALG